VYQFSYLYGALGVGTVWLLFFLLRSDLRRPMFQMSLLFGIGGISDIVYMEDWYHPETLLGTSIGIESFVFGFFMGGCLGFAYEVLFGKRIVDRADAKPAFSFRYLGSLLVVLFFGLFYLAGMHSFPATIIGLGVPIVILLFIRRDLLVNSLITGFFSLLLAYVYIGLPELLTPGWVDASWQFDKLSGIRIGVVPMEDLVWFLLIGLFVGPIYKYWKNMEIGN